MNKEMITLLLICSDGTKLSYSQDPLHCTQTYLYITILRIMMDRQRQTKDILHPMYEIIDNALSSSDGVDG